MLVVGCSTAVSGLCYPDMKGCTFVDGPANATINYVSEVPVSTNMFYHIQVSWEVSDKILRKQVLISSRYKELFYKMGKAAKATVLSCKLS